MINKNSNNEDVEKEMIAHLLKYSNTNIINNMHLIRIIAQNKKSDIKDLIKHYDGYSRILSQVII